VRKRLKAGQGFDQINRRTVLAGIAAALGSSARASEVRGKADQLREYLRHVLTAGVVKRTLAG
jgi:hypothetical protein